MSRVPLRTLQTECHKETKRLLWYIFAGTRGGIARIKIILILRNSPVYTHQLARNIGMDYKAIQHHLKLLVNNNLIVKTDHKYGALLYLSPLLKSHIAVFDEIITKMKELAKENFLGEKA